MLKKKSSYTCLALLLGLFLGVFADVTPTLGQTGESLLDDGFRAGGYFGPCFDSEQSTERCWVFMGNVQWHRFVDDLKRLFRGKNADASKFQYTPLGRSPVRRRARAEGDSDFSLQFTMTASGTDTWPMPGGGSQANPEYSAKTGESAGVAQEAGDVAHTTVSGLIELMLPVPVEPHFLVEPFVGFGVARIFEGEQRNLNFSLQNAWIPVMSYGVGITLQKKSGWAFMVQYRGFIYFPKSLEYTGPQEVSLIEDAIGTVTTESLFFGVGYRFGGS